MSTPEIKLKNSISERDHAVGPTNAPVTLVEYGNFECIHCGQFFPVMKQTRKFLGDNLRFVFRHFPIVRTHPHALQAAIAAEGAGEQQKFWEMHDELFTHQNSLEDHDILRYARRIRLDLDRFQRDISDSKLRLQIQADYDRSVFDEHITGTPTIYLNEVRYTGATDFESLLEAIRAADVDKRIQWPGKLGRFRNVLGRRR